MEAGRELDALVAEKVMGWSYQDFPDGPCPHVKHWYATSPCPNDAMDPSWRGRLPCFSTDIAAAWEVVEKDDGWGFDWRLKRWAASSKPWTCIADRITDSRRFYVEAVTAPLAICLAALAATGRKG